MSQMIPENLRRDPKITMTQTTPTAPITLTDDIRRQSAPSPQGRRPGEILQGRGAKALEELVPEVAPASSRKGWSRPWSGRGGKRDGADPHHSDAGARPRGSDRGVKPSPLPGMRGMKQRSLLGCARPRAFSPWGRHPKGCLSDRTGQGRVTLPRPPTLLCPRVVG
jgi:hypothetical protein